MALSDVDKTLYLDKPLFIAVASQTNLQTADTVVALIPVTKNGEIEAIGVCFTASGGTTPALTAKVLRGSTVLISATATADDTPVVTEAVQGSIPVYAGEMLKVAIASFNADNDFGSPGITVQFNPNPSDA